MEANCPQEGDEPFLEAVPPVARPRLNRTQSFPPSATCLTFLNNPDGIAPSFWIEYKTLLPLTIPKSNRSKESLLGETWSTTSLAGSAAEKKASFRDRVQSKWLTTQNKIQHIMFTQQYHRRQKRALKEKAAEAAQSAITPFMLDNIKTESTPATENELANPPHREDERTSSTPHSPVLQTSPPKAMERLTPESIPMGPKKPTQQERRVAAAERISGTGTGPVRRKNIVNPPHELSKSPSEIADEQRGRGRPSKDLYLKGFTAKGQMVVSQEPPQPPRPQRHRTASGQRRSWREPPAGIVTVVEEDDYRSLGEKALAAHREFSRSNRMRTSSHTTLC